MKCVAQFYQHSAQNNYQTQLKGYPVYEDKDYVRILIPGDRNLITEREVTNKDKELYHREWEIYKAGKIEISNGTPIEQWPSVTPAQVQTLKYFNIYSVEQLAATSDSSIQNLGMGYLALREKAKTFLKMAEGIEVNSKLENEVLMLKQQLRKLEEAQLNAYTPPLIHQENPYSDQLEEINLIQNEIAEAGLDKRGNLFNPDIHDVDEDGVPIMTSFGYWKKKKAA
jgi:hypothetical protein